MDAGTSGINFDHDYGTYRVRKAETPESVVAHREDCVIDMFQRHSFAPRQVDHGGWAGRVRSPTNNISLDAVIADLEA